jgi:hypothetical protein
MIHETNEGAALRQGVHPDREVARDREQSGPRS